MSRRPPRPRIIRYIPDPSWGALLVGATPEQRRRCDVRLAKDHLLHRDIVRVGGAVVAVGLALVGLVGGDRLGMVIGVMLVLYGGIFVAAAVLADRAPRLRLRWWGVYEAGILCASELYRGQASFMRWGDIEEVKMLYEWATGPGAPEGRTWTVWVKAAGKRTGMIAPAWLSHHFGMTPEESRRVAEAVMAEARRRLGNEKVVVAGTWLARRQAAKPPTGRRVAPR